VNLPLITVLGSSGLLGTALTRELADRRVRLRLVSRKPTSAPAGTHAEVDVRAVELSEEGALSEAIAGSDAIIHLVKFSSGDGNWRVATGDTAAERVNLGLVHDLIDAVRTERRERPPQVLFSGTVTQGITTSSGEKPATEYCRQKLAAETALLAATAEGVLRATSLRLTTLYSQGIDSTDLDRGVTTAMTRRAVAGEPLTIWHGGGDARRDLLCVDDAARAFTAALDSPDTVTGRHWQIGTGHSTTVQELFTTIAEVVAVHTGRPPVPVVSTPPPEHAVAIDQLDTLLDPVPFQRATGWAPRVPLAEGLDRLAAAVAKPAAAAITY
jgi:nucleoside-diphosphate-sugar epimerase